MVDEIVRSFLCYVYPLLPILRLDTFLSALEGKPGHTISPLLFQAVLLAGAVFVDFSGFRHAGYQQCKDVQRTLFGRAKALYDMEVEVNPVTVVQSLLLMTYWHSRLNDFQGRVHWLRIAISLATEAGLHNSNLRYEDPAENDFRRRLWSCCIIRSSLVCIGERRQALVPQAVLCFHDPNLLKWDDTSLSRALEYYSVAHLRQQLELFGTLFFQEVELCREIQHVLHTLYEFSGVRVSEPGIPIMTLIPKTEAMGSLVISLDERLRMWHGQALQLGLFERRHNPFGSLVSLHSAVLEMLYYTSLSTVHRPMMLRQWQTDTATEALRRFSSSTLRSSACRITDIARDLEVNHEISLLPPVGTAMFIAASLQHLQDSMSTNLDECRSGSLYLGQVLRIFRLLTERYNHVNTAIEYIARVQNGNGEQFDHYLEWEERVSPTGRWETHRVNALLR
ncbi:Cutinase transcription factor 1 beta [Cyphellophora attinorum]|uniref:Cutinase transcription factor 1 beta n=1 Tax=Cyphellophora attinorum TaxID=1664694 RepID=A0A0N1GXG0_9EURO|nr:Cutinase transcription factor 1 beta [Phialophora attinorum]KPI34993.1 Cutinase transcription factor 1 beta [Phialophora attinorum]